MVVNIIIYIQAESILLSLEKIEPAGRRRVAVPQYKISYSEYLPGAPLPLSLKMSRGPKYDAAAFALTKPSPAHVYCEELHLKQDIWALPEAALVYIDRPGPKHYSYVADVCESYKYGLLHCYWTLDGKKDGPYHIYWHTDNRGYMYAKFQGYMGQFREMHYRNDVLEGAYRQWDMYGYLTRMCSYVSGLLEGPCEFKLDDTHIKGTCSYSAGLVDGAVELSFREEPYGTLLYRGGVLQDGTYTLTRRGGSCHSWCAFNLCDHTHCSGVNGEFTSCHALTQHGEYSKEFTVVNGRLEGELIHSYPLGVVRVRIHYKGGLIDGTYETYHENGALESRVEWADGHKAAGRWTYYDDRGGVLKVYGTDASGAYDGEFVHYKYNPRNSNYELIARWNYKAGVLHGEYYEHTTGRYKTRGRWYYEDYTEEMTYEEGKLVGIYVHEDKCQKINTTIHFTGPPGSKFNVTKTYPTNWYTGRVQFTALNFKRPSIRDGIRLVVDGYYYTWDNNSMLRDRTFYKMGTRLTGESFRQPAPTVVAAAWDSDNEDD